MSKKRTTVPIQSLVPAPATPVKFINGSDSGPFRIKLHVKPGAKITQIIDYSDDCVGVQISAPPRDGEANKEVVRFMAEVFHVKERQVELIAGHKSRDKIVCVTPESANFTLETILNLINPRGSN